MIKEALNLQEFKVMAKMFFDAGKNGGDFKKIITAIYESVVDFVKWYSEKK